MYRGFSVQDMAHQVGGGGAGGRAVWIGLQSSVCVAWCSRRLVDTWHGHSLASQLLLLARACMDCAGCSAAPLANPFCRAAHPVQCFGNTHEQGKGRQVGCASQLLRLSLPVFSSPCLLP